MFTEVSPLINAAKDHATIHEFSILETIPKEQLNYFTSLIGVIFKVNNNLKEFGGTGFLINSKMIITAAHVCVSKA